MKSNLKWSWMCSALQLMLCTRCWVRFSSPPLKFSWIEPLRTDLEVMSSCIIGIICMLWINCKYHWYVVLSRSRPSSKSFNRLIDAGRVMGKKAENIDLKQKLYRSRINENFPLQTLVVCWPIFLTTSPPRFPHLPDLHFSIWNVRHVNIV